MTEADTPVPREARHPYDAGYRAIKADPPATSVLRCDECRETLTLIPEQDDPKPAETRFLADHACRHAAPDRNDGSVDFTIPHRQPVRSGEVAFSTAGPCPASRPRPRPNNPNGGKGNEIPLRLRPGLQDPRLGQGRCRAGGEAALEILPVQEQLAAMAARMAVRDYSAACPPVIVLSRPLPSLDHILVSAAEYAEIKARHG